jgi:diguanylate cyclase (GGDEF)-like protein
MIDYGTIYINAFAIIILAFMLKNYTGQFRFNEVLDRIFISLLICNIILCITVPSLVLLWGIPGEFIRVLLYIIQTADFIFTSLLAMSWLYYCIFRTIQKPLNSFLLKYIVPLPFVILTILLIATIGRNLIFSVSLENFYVRGPWFILTLGTTYLYIISALILVIVKRKRLSTGEFFPYLLMPLAPTVIGVFEAIVASPIFIVWPATALVFLTIQMHVLDNKSSIDHLTSLNSRMALDEYLKNKISVDLVKRKPLGIIMLDLDHFKIINDTLGHTEGDRALQTASGILINTLQGKYFAGRYGGDEFTIIINGCSANMMKKIVTDIQNNTQSVNEQSKKSYQIEFSIGSYIFKHSEYSDIHTMISKVDTLMYENKQAKKAAR